MSDMNFSHLLLTNRDRREVCRYRSYAARLGSGPPIPVEFTHEADGSCCKRECLKQTEALLQAGLQIPGRLGLTKRGRGRD
jgi:hypothetical protein